MKSKYLNTKTNIPSENNEKINKKIFFKCVFALLQQQSSAFTNIIVKKVYKSIA